MRLTPGMYIVNQFSQTGIIGFIGHCAVGTENEVLRSILQDFVHLRLSFLDGAVDEHPVMVETTEDGAMEDLLCLLDFLQVKLRQVDDAGRIVSPVGQVLILATTDVKDVDGSYLGSHLRNILIPLAVMIEEHFIVLSEPLLVTAMT